MPLRALANLVGPRVHTLPLVVVYLTEACNSKCVTCDYWQTGTRRMTGAMAHQLGDELRRLRTREVVVSGGEPLVHPRWTELVDRIVPDDAQASLVSNGLLVARQAAAVIARFSAVYLSLDGATAATYERIRGVDGLDRVLDAARVLRDARIPVTFRCTVQDGNVDELPALVDRAREVGAVLSLLAVDTTHPEAFGREGAPAAHPEDMAERFAAAVTRLEDADPRALSDGTLAGGRAGLDRLHARWLALDRGDSPPPQPCNAPRFSTVIEPDGRLRPCYFLPVGARYEAGPLGDALNAGPMRDLRRQQAAGERPECVGCVCTLHRGPRALLAGPDAVARARSSAAG